MRHPFIAIIAILLAAPFAAAQGIITTVAGGGPNNLPAASANLSAPVGLTRDTAGNLYVSTNGQHRIFKIDGAGNLTVFAGNGTQGYSGDFGPATSATLNQPRTMAFDLAGNLYVAELQNHTVRRIDTITGMITTVAGTGVQGYNGDNIPATSARLNAPHGVAIDSAGNLFIAEYNPGCRIRRVDHLTGIITTVAGNGSCVTSGDGGPARAANDDRCHRSPLRY